MNTGIKAVLFDWGGVLAPSDNAVGAQVLSKKYSVDSKAFKSYCKKHEDEYGDTDGDAGFLESIAERFSLRSQEVASALNAAVPHEGYVLAKQVAVRFPTYLVSNQLKFRTDYIREHFDLSFFTNTFFSNEIGLLKPHPVFFAYVLGQIKKDAEECIFIDDNEDNIATAVAMGFVTLLVKSTEQMKSELEKMGALK